MLTWWQRELWRSLCQAHFPAIAVEEQAHWGAPVVHRIVAGRQAWRQLAAAVDADTFEALAEEALWRARGPPPGARPPDPQEQTAGDGGATEEGDDG